MPKAIQAPDIPGLIDSVLEHLKPNGQGRKALLNANLLLTNLMSLLRPVRVKKPEPGEPRVLSAAKQLGLNVQMLQILRDAVFRGITEIESGDQLAARETFKAALDLWQDHKP
jgi:hypothetical protein